MKTGNDRSASSKPPSRIKCEEHGVAQAKLPWAEEGSRFTTMFEALAIDYPTRGQRQARPSDSAISWRAWHLMERAVWRGQAAIRVSLSARSAISKLDVSS
jgi:hypothetical protein